MYNAMLSEDRNQCCVITGESGAGKTESCKFILQHLLNVAQSGEKGLAAKIAQVGKVLTESMHSKMNAVWTVILAGLEQSFASDRFSGR